MTDSDCTRRGEGHVPVRYRAPEPDQCPDCRCAPGGEHNPECGAAQPATLMLNTDREWEEPVNIPLALQRRLLEQALLDDMQGRVHAFIDEHWDEIVDLSFEGLDDGYREFGSAMYAWPTDVRTREALCEARDIVVYLSGGDVE